MILVENVNIISEDTKYILYFNTLQGFYHQEISEHFADKIKKALGNEKTLCTNLLENSHLELNHCLLSVIDKNLTAVVTSETQEFTGAWQEGLLIALSMKISIFLDNDLLIDDFQTDREHEILVEELITQEERYDYANQIKEMIQQMSQAIADERYEEAAVLRDQIKGLDAKKGKDS